ncbi:DUF6578 domain-containing protein [Streptomyces sp. NPDC012888]|uniref:DUF6578 domain-containing protein n=1 Tax=Streptomyces sp. NPDC012888 TaxID=3364855 RepID=UPI0036746116
MAVTVWVDDWQMQCCGGNFAVGEVVSWNLMPVDPADYADVVGGARASEIDFREDHHLEAEDGVTTALQVLEISEVHCRYEVPAGSAGNVYHPVPGTAVLVPVVEADGWAEARPAVRFTGYLVTARHAGRRGRVERE